MKKCCGYSGNILMQSFEHKEIADACHFSLNELKYEYPEEITTEGRTPQEELKLIWPGKEPKKFLEKFFRKKQFRQ